MKKKHPTETRSSPSDGGKGIRSDGDKTTPPQATPAGSPEFRVVCDDMNLRIGRDGVWYSHGSPISRKELVCLFASVLTRNEAGEYWLVTPTELCPVEVEDVPFLAVEMFTAGTGQEQVISFRSNVDEIVSVDNDHPLYVITDPETGEPSPYLILNNDMEARLIRSVFYDLVARGLEENIDGESFFGVWSSGCFFPLGKLDGKP